MNAKENALVAISKIPANSGHSLHKGTPREAFIREFLESHLPENVAIGTGEIIDANSRPGEKRNQFDIVIYKNNYPKLDFGGGVCGFLIESVIATVEVKSTLTKPDIVQSINAAVKVKALLPSVNSSFHTGYIPPKILNYVITYNGPAQIETVYNWTTDIHKELGIIIENLPLENDKRLAIPSPSIDGVFILNKGFLYFDNVPYGFAHPQNREAIPKLKWVYCDTQVGNLLLFFIFLQTATHNIEAKWLNPIPYLTSCHMDRVLFGSI
jgi:hypothetical protein